MGLRFRKIISIASSVKLNIGKTGMSVSAGVPGFRKTFHTSGKVTTSVGIPGTGLYYVDTDNSRTQSRKRQNNTQKVLTKGAEELSNIPENHLSDYSDERYENYRNDSLNVSVKPEQIDINSIKSIYKTSDDSIDWTEVLVSIEPLDDTYNKEMWQYYRSMASKILSGDIDAYLQLIYEDRFTI